MPFDIKKQRMNKDQEGSTEETASVGLVPQNQQITQPKEEEAPKNTFSYADAFDGNQDPNRQAIEDQYNYLRSATAKDLLDKQIQTEQAKIAAQRSLENSLASRGLNNGGYYGNANAQLQSAYLSQQNRNLADYQEAARQNEITRSASLASLANEDANSYLNGVLEGINGAGDLSNAIRVLGDYGIKVTDDGKGHYSLSGDRLASLSETQRSQILSAMGNAKANEAESEKQADLLTADGINTIMSNGITDLDRFNKLLAPYGLQVEVGQDGSARFVGEGLANYDQRTINALNSTLNYAYDADSAWLAKNTVDGNGFSSYEEGKALNVTTEDENYGLEDVKSEAKALFDKYANNRQNGDAVRLEHYGGGSANGLYLVYYNGKWYKTDKAHYDSATNKAFFKNGKIQKDKSAGSFVNDQKQENPTYDEALADIFNHKAGDRIVTADGRHWVVVNNSGLLSLMPIPSNA